MQLPELLKQLDEVNSPEEGLSIVLASAQQLDDSIAAGLFAKASELKSAGDPDGAEEYENWAKVARSIITRRDLLSKPVSSPEDGLAQLNAQRERFDDAFIEHCVRVAGAPMGDLQEAIESEDTEQAKTIADRINPGVTFATGFLKAITMVTKLAAHQAHADFTEGCWLLLLTRLARMKGGPSEDAGITKRAEADLTACAANEAAPPEMRARAENNLATLLFPDMPQVRAHQEAALQLAEKSKDRELTQSMRRQRAYWAREEKNWTRVYELSRQNLDESEHAVVKQYSPQLVTDLVKSARTDTRAITEACLELGKNDPTYYERAVEAAEWGKGRRFLRVVMTLASGYKPIPERLLQRRARLNQLSAEWGQKLGLMPYEAAERHKATLENIQTLIGRTQEQIEKFARRRAFDLRTFPCQFPEMVKLVPANGVILSYFVMPEQIVLYVIADSGLAQPPVVIDLDRKRLAKALVNVEITAAMRADFRDWDQLQRDIDMKIDAVWPTDKLAFLYHKLIEPIIKQTAGRSVVYLSPDDMLLELPFQAFLARDGTCLIDAAPIAHIPGVAVLKRCLEVDQDRKRDSIFAAGVPLSQGGPEVSEEEARTVAAFFKAEPQPAMRTAVLGEGMRADILHLSCHSNLQNVLTGFQGLQLADGPLTNAEINAASNRSTLAVLSACETSRGDLYSGEELAGFVGAFMRAGCPSVIACMWKMPEAVSLDFVKAFYHSLVEEKSSKAAALRAGLLAIKIQKRFDHPYFWAPLCLYGAA